MVQDVSAVYEQEPKDIDLQKVQSNVLEITQKMKYEIMRCAACPVLRECSHPKSKLEKLRTEAEMAGQDVYEEEIELDDTKENVIRARRKKMQVVDAFIRDHAHEVLKNERCVFEKRDVLNILQRFTDSGYNLSDPRIHLTVTELLVNTLHIGRANKAFTSMGMLIRRDTPSGPVYYNNPAIRYRTEAAKLMIETIEALDRMLKSDANKVSDNSFTSHLLKKLQVKSKAIADDKKGKELTEINGQDL